MRNQTIGGIILKTPDDAIFAYNPNYLEIEGATDHNIATVTLRNPAVSGTTKVIYPSIYGGRAKIYISNLLQIIMRSYNASNTYPSYVRNTPIVGTVVIGETTFSISFHCIAGSLEIGQRWGQIGSYIFDPGEEQFIRRVRWFKNFPQTVSIYFQESSTIQTRYDGNGYAATTTNEGSHTLVDYDLATIFPNAQRLAVIKCTPESESAPTSKFDKTYDYTFYTLGETVSMIRLYVDNSKEGHYLRWVDNLGQIQYWLFTKGIESIKTTDGGSEETDAEYKGMAYGRIMRVFDKSRDREIKCAAVNLTRDELEYVKTIVASVDVEMYLESGIWVPVNIKAGTFDMSEKQDLLDFEIIIEMPTQQTQIR